MKKMINLILSTLLFVVFIFVGSVVAATSQSTTTVGFYRSDHTKGIANEGPKHLATHGYSYNIYADASVSQFISALANKDVIFVNSHGSAGMITLSTSSSVTGNQIVASSFLSNAELVYLSTCQTGMHSNTNGNFCSALVNKGVDTVVAFTQNITASTDTDGIHRFNSIVVYKLICGYSVYDALETAKIQIYSESMRYWGADSYVIYGSRTTVIN